MSTRTSSILALMLLAGCEREPASASAPEPGQDAIECAVDGSPAFAPTCTVERVRGEQGLQLVVRHPGGSFRRFDVLSDGRGLATADGAQAGTVALREGGIEVTVGSDRYRFPATVAK
jgi:hypothetical protein